MPRIFKSKTLETAQSGVGSNGPPHVAAAFATRMSIRSSARSRSTSCSISGGLDRSAAYPTAVPDEPAREFNFFTAWLKPCGPSAFRATRMTFFAPASKNAVAVCKPRPRDPSGKSRQSLFDWGRQVLHKPPVITATLPSRRKSRGTADNSEDRKSVV